MAYIIAEPCVDVMDKACVEVCPVDCIYEPEATNLARALVNEPGNRVNPSRLADKAREVSERFGLDIEILSEPEIQELGMEALLAVARGSDEPARLIVLKHMGAGHEAPMEAALVGKGVTFDSGGLSLKSSASMENMKSDIPAKKRPRFGSSDMYPRLNT